MLGAAVDDDIANQICAKLLYLEGEDDASDIWLYINSPGGSVTAGMAIYDTMQFVGCDVATVCLGLAASMGQFLLTAGAAGKRFTLPNARIMMHQPLAGLRGQASDIAIQAQEHAYVKQRMAELIAQHSGKTRRPDQDRLRARPLVHRRPGPGVRALRQGDRAPRRDPLTPPLAAASGPLSPASWSSSSPTARRRRRRRRHRADRPDRRQVETAVRRHPRAHDCPPTARPSRSPAGPARPPRRRRARRRRSPSRARRRGRPSPPRPPAAPRSARSR